MRAAFMLTVLLIFSAVASTESTPVKNPKNVLWLDAHANFERLGSVDNIQRVLKKAKSVGFTDIVLDLKGIDGYVLYPSRTAPVLREYNGFRRADDYDFPGIVLREAHKVGLRVYFSMNVFAEGDKKSHRGIVYEKHPEWQCQVYTKDGIVPIVRSFEEIAAFVNPILPEVRQYEISLWKELLTMYKPDGIVIDRCRYPNISADFSEASRKAFESFIGRQVKNWPEDVYRLVVQPDGKEERVEGPFFKEWLEWRAKVIYDFFRDLRDTVKKIDPDIAFSDYVGAWYPIYYDVGVNWASNEYRPEKDYGWADSTYYRTGYAELLDFLFVGNYFYDVTEEEAIRSHSSSHDGDKKPSDYWWYSVEGSAKIAMKVTKGVIPVYGSLYVEQYKEKNNPQQFVRAIKKVRELTDGIMIFDLVHLDTNDWWRYVKEGLK